MSRIIFKIIRTIFKVIFSTILKLLIVVAGGIVCIFLIWLLLSNGGVDLSELNSLATSL